MSQGMKAEDVEPGQTVPLDVAQPPASLGSRDLEGAEGTALVFRTLVSPLRVRTIGYLRQHRPTNRSQLTSVIGETWSIMQHHLTALLGDGFLT